MSTTALDPGAIAAKYGALNSTPAASSNTDGQDSAAIAAKYGALNVNPDDSGQVTNDVGNPVVVPKEGESFADTMRRGAARGRTLIDSSGNLNAEGQKEVAAETKTMPAKTAQTLGAAAGIGVAGPAALAGAGEVLSAMPGASKAALDFVESQAAQYAANYPHLIALAKTLGIAGGPAGVLLYLHKLAGK